MPQIFPPNFFFYMKPLLVSLLVFTEVPDVIGIAKYSYLPRLIRVTAQVFMFIKLLKSQDQEGDGSSTEDVNLALAHLIRVSQTTLQGNWKLSEWKRQFSLFKGATGVWRCRGPLANADVPLSARFPTLLDKGEPLTPLIVMDYHGKVKHRGVNCTLAELRSSYCVVEGKQLVKKMLLNCFICRRYHAGKAIQGTYMYPSTAWHEGEGGTSIFLHRDQFCCPFIDERNFSL